MLKKMLFVVSVSALFTNVASAGFIGNGGVAIDAGPTAVQQFGTDGYDLYGVVGLGNSFGDSGNSGAPRVTQLPSYISSIALQGTDTYYGSPGYSLVLAPNMGIQRIGLYDNVEPESQGALGQERSLLSIVLGNGAPSTFSIGVILDGSQAPTDYPDKLRLESILQPASTTISPNEAFSDGSLDVYFFNVSGFTPGETFVLLGTESDFKDNGYNGIAISGLVFPGTVVPEPATTGLLALPLIAGLMARRRQSQKSPL